MYYNHLGKIATDLINSSSFLVPKASLKIIISVVCSVNTTYLHLVGSEGIIIAKPEWAPPAFSRGGRFFADPKQRGGLGSWLPGTVTPVLPFV